MKKVLAIVLALCMVLALCACGTAAKTDTSAAPATSAAATGTDTNTVAVGAVIIARDDVPTDEIYTFVKTIFDNASALGEQHAKGKELDLKFASSVTSVPYHPGAAKYFKEKGIDVASVKDGAGTGTTEALTFGTGGDTGTYYGFGGVLASYVSGNSDVSVTAVTSDGSKANIEDLASGDVQIAFAQSDVLSYAYNGERLFDGAAVKGFSVVAALYMEQVQIVTTNPDIKSVSDLKGKTVSIGAAGSGVYFNATDVLSAYGLTEKDITPVYQSFGDSADSLKDGKIDAAFIVAGAPTTAITDLATSGAVYLVSLDETHVNQLLETSPFYSAYTIPAGTYASK
jgi:TRAP transporter TAXI family solute receptor